MFIILSLGACRQLREQEALGPEGKAKSCPVSQLLDWEGLRLMIWGGGVHVYCLLSESLVYSSKLLPTPPDSSSIVLRSSATTSLLIQVQPMS